MKQRPSWNKYFMSLAELAATRSTCISRQVGVVIVKNKRVLVTGYNGVPSGLPHCTDLGYCHQGDNGCINSAFPSRAIHAEVNAIAQAARQGISLEGAIAFITLEPCVNCFKALVATGISEIIYKNKLDNTQNCPIKTEYTNNKIISLKSLKSLEN